MATTQAWPRGPRQRLPRTITPFAAEAATSYTARLAHANHINACTLHCYVSESRGKRPRPDWLAIVSGQPEQLICSRLHGLAGELTPPRQSLRRALCKKCMVRKGIHDPVYCYPPAHVTVCRRHQCWIGPPAQNLDDQIDLQHRPRVLGAARTHRRLARHHTEADLRHALGDARHMLVYWAHSEHCSSAPILRRNLHAHVTAYPDLIAIAATLLTMQPHVEHHSSSTQSGSVTVLVDRINQRTGSHHDDCTPIEQWVQNRRLAVRGQQ